MVSQLQPEAGVQHSASLARRRASQRMGATSQIPASKGTAAVCLGHVAALKRGRLPTRMPALGSRSIHILATAFAHDRDSLSELPSATAPSPPAAESLIVLTRDGVLLETLQAVASAHRIRAVSSEEELVIQLVNDHGGVAVIDTDALATPANQLTEQLKTQFPDLVLVVAGNSQDQMAFAAQIATGAVYRFLHKPLSEQRVRLLVDAAWR